MAEISRETGRQIGALIDRKGYVEYVIIGDARRIILPDLKRTRVATDRFRGLRCLHTHLRGEELTQDDLTDLALLRLDLMAAIEIDHSTGYPNKIYCAHLLPHNSNASTLNNSSSPYALLEPVSYTALNIDFLSLIGSLEEEMARAGHVHATRPTKSTAASFNNDHNRAILVGLTTDALFDAEASMNELSELALSAGLQVLDRFIQRRGQIDARTVIGRGKLEDIIIRALQLGADMILFDRELQPTQVRSISEATDLKIIDRAQLILDIFAQRARDSEGKVQVELAQLKYLLPRLVVGQDSAFSRLAGGIGGRGPGETKLETDRRRVRERIHRLEREIESFRMRRQQRRNLRQRREYPFISIVGYTNAGKSTLLNTLTSSHVHVEQKMFATLDPTSRRLRLPHEQEVIINDTVGFIRDLPPELFAAFRATLEEIRESDLLIHLIDAATPRREQQFQSVEQILTDLELTQIPRLIVFNKIDLVARHELDAMMRFASGNGAFECCAVSARSPESLPPLLEKIGFLLARDLTSNRSEHRVLHRRNLAEEIPTAVSL